MVAAGSAGNTIVGIGSFGGNETFIGKIKDDDTAMELDMVNDPKEIAEHLMLIDLGRNDVGRIAEPGSVEVIDLNKIKLVAQQDIGKQAGGIAFWKMEN